MKRLIQIAFFALTGVVATSGAHAQSMATANIPFDFTVQDRTMPRGTYLVEKLDSSFIVQLRSRDGKNNGLYPAYPADRKSGTAQGGKLIFHRFGDQYFLNEVQSATDDSTMRLPVSKTEKRARQNEASIHSDSVAVVAMK